MSIDKFVLGISQITDMDELLKKGYRNFYFGYIPQEYYQKYDFQISLNRRYYQKEQFIDLDKAYKIIDKIHQKNGKVSLVLNPINFSPEMFELSKKLISLFIDKVDSIIVSNIALLTYLSQLNYKNIILSNLFGLYTIEAINFFTQNFSIRRIILPRDVEIDFIKQVLKTFPDLEVEIFLYGDNCPFSEAFCFAEHGYEEVSTPLCMQTFSNLKPVKTINPNIKGRILNGLQQEYITKQPLDIQSLINQLMESYNNQDTEKVEKILNVIIKFDKNYLLRYYHQLKFILTFIQTPQSQKILKKLKQQQTDSYKIFHKLNTVAIEKILEIFKTYQNIYFKIPSRGRKFDIQPSKRYNYKESQYKL